MRLSRSALLATTVALFSLSACNGANPTSVVGLSNADTDPATATYASSLNVNIGSMFKTPSGLYYKDLTTGTGATAGAGYTVRVTYTGWLVNGNKFDSTDGRTPAYFEFLVNAGQVIKGWDEGVQGMKVGGTRQLVIPYQLAYGTGGSSSIPGYATLVFQISLTQVR